MKFTALFFLTACTVCTADEPSLTTSTLDAGGGTSSGDDVEVTGSLGGFSGVSSDTEITTTARAGFTGQIYDPARVDITPGSATLQENVIVDFTAQVVCDDDTILPGETVQWSVDSPLLQVTAGGRVGTGLLPLDFTSLLTASAAGVTGSVTLTLADTDPDNFGSYAGDGLPDAWQIIHFGYDNSRALPDEDPDKDGQDNRTEYLAGTDPNDGNSYLRLFFSAETPPPGARLLEFSPFLPNRIYILEACSSLVAPWTEIPAAPAAASIPGNGLIPDAGPDALRKFYRLQIKSE